MLPIKIQLYLILILTALYMPLSTMDLIDSMKSESPIIDLKQTSDEWNVERELQKKDQGNQVKILQQL